MNHKCTSVPNPHPDQNQNVTDPQLWFDQWKIHSCLTDFLIVICLRYVRQIW
jgi:hypothetical protein